MEKVFEIGLLLDFYGQLLTERQYEIMDLHYNNDYSLGEIAEQLNISRQGVFDNIKRGKATLNGLEQKLGLVKKFTEQKNKAQEILKFIEKIDTGDSQSLDRNSLVKIKDAISDIINKF